MGLGKVIANLTQSGVGKKICNYVLNPKNEQKVTTGLLVAHQTTCELLGLGICVFNKKMDDESKKHQTISHLIKAGLNLTAISAVSTATGKFANTISKNLKTSDAVKMGVTVGIPLIVSTLVSRFIVPVFVNNIATDIRNKLFHDCPNKLKNKNGSQQQLIQPKYQPLTLENYMKATKLDVKA